MAGYNGPLLDYVTFLKGSSGEVLGGGTDIHGIPANLSNFEGCIFMLLGSSSFSIESATEFQILIQGTNTSSTQFASTGFATYTTGQYVIKSTAPTVGMDYRFWAIDVYKPLHKFVKMRVKNSTGVFNMLSMPYAPKRIGSTELRDSTYIGGSTRFVGAT